MTATDLVAECRLEEPQNVEPKAPTVMLFGWFGCRDRYLSKYSDLYKSKGCVEL